MRRRRRPIELSTYRQGLLIAGLLASRLYRYRAAAGPGTTAVGGFDDLATAGLAGGGFTPLIIQAIGRHPDTAQRDSDRAKQDRRGPG